MKWINASESFPAYSYPVYVKCAHGKRVMYSTPLGWMDFETDKVYLCHDDVNEKTIFWLDETSPTPEPGKEYTREDMQAAWLSGKGEGIYKRLSCACP